MYVIQLQPYSCQPYVTCPVQPFYFLLFLAVTLECFGSSADVWVVGADVLFCSAVLISCVSGFLV